MTAPSEQIRHKISSHFIDEETEAQCWAVLISLLEAQRQCENPGAFCTGGQETSPAASGWSCEPEVLEAHVFHLLLTACLLSAVAVIQSIPVFNESGRFSFTLPYPVKMKVRFSFFLQVYLVMLFLGKYVSCHILDRRAKWFSFSIP